MSRELRRLVGEAFKDRWTSMPLLASGSGVNGYDHTLGDWSNGFAQERLKVKKKILRGLSALSLSDPEEILDRKVLTGHLRVQTAEIESYQRLTWDTALYPLTAVRALDILRTRKLSGAKLREMMVSRLRQMPLALAQGLANITIADGDSARLTAGACEETAEFIKKTAARYDKRAAREACEALECFSKSVQRRFLPRAKKRYPTGRALFDLKLKHEHGLPYDSQQLMEIGREAVSSLRAEIRTAARRIDPRSEWRQVLHSFRRHCPTSQTLLKVYRAESARARRFCVDKNLVGLPRGESLKIIPTPRFEWDTTPYAAMMPPGPFDTSRESLFWVTPVDPRWPARKKRERLEGHCLFGLPSVCPHEGYPGHHIQLLRSNLFATRVRSVFTTPVMVEGWGLYCEQMMEEEGFSTDPRARLFRLKDALWRACRVVVDCGLHTRGWTHERSVSYMVREAMLERTNAEAEVNRYATSPTQPMSYHMGKREILKLREKCRTAWGARFTLRRFHDWLLDHGSMPPSWIKVPRRA